MKSIKFLFIPIFLLFASIVFAQTYSDTTWERWYGEPNRHENPWHERDAIHYDHGILTMQHIDQNSYACILQKTDVNGYLLWSKYFDAPVQIKVKSIVTDEFGAIYLGGSFLRSNGIVTNPLIIKLNACGELEWCKKINIDELKMSHIWDIAVDHNGDIVWLIKNNSDYSLNTSCQLLKTTSDGDVLWHNCYIKKEDYPSMVNNQIQDINISPQNDYYLSGDAIFPDYYVPGEWLRYRAIAIKVNEEGKEEWICPLGIYDEVGSFSDMAFEFENDGTIWGGIVADSASGSQPGIFKFNEAGVIIDYFFQPILEGITTYNEVYFRKKIKNNLNAARLVYSISPNVNIPHYGTVVFDNDFGVYNYILNQDYTAGIPFTTIMSHDSLLLNVSSCYNCNGTQYSDVYLAKYNADLSFANTIDDTTWEYDYLCDYPILSDTVYLACDPIGVEELKPPVQKEAKELPIEIKGSPNPAKNHIQLQLEYSEDFKNLNLQVFNIKGQEMYQEDVLSGVKELNIKTRKWESGMYIVILRSEGIMVGNTKFVIEK